MKQKYQVEIRFQLNGKDVVVENYSGEISSQMLRRDPLGQQLLDAIESVNTACRRLETAGKIGDYLSCE